jgi:hypothetical protein
MRRQTRSRKRGGALATAMLFFVVVTIAGASLLSMSLITQESMIRSSYDVRLLIAAEAGIETVRGRFTLVEGELDDWGQILPDPNNWNNLGGPMTINGIQVQAQGISTGTPAVPRARLRAIATLRNRNRVVEYEIRVPSFSDYALYEGSTSGMNNVPAYTKVWGPVYSKNDLSLNNSPGIEFFGEVTTSGTVKGVVDPVYTFKQGYEENVPTVDLPPTLFGMDILRNAAAGSGTLFYGNTQSIEFLPNNQFRRVFNYRASGGNEMRSEVRPVPDNSVIFVGSGRPPQGVDADGNLNNTTTYSTLNLLGGTLGVPGEPESGARVTLATENHIDLLNTVKYQTLLENPDLRKVENKMSPAAIGYREMLGVVTSRWFTAVPGDWTRLDSTQMVSGGLPRQFPMDGVFMSTDRLLSRGSSSNVSEREFWLNGGLISGRMNLDFMASHFNTLNYHTDYRLQFTMPPYFLRAYGDSVLMVRGSWRTYELPNS